MSWSDDTNGPFVHVAVDDEGDAVAYVVESAAGLHKCPTVNALGECMFSLCAVSHSIKEAAKNATQH